MGIGDDDVSMILIIHRYRIPGYVFYFLDRIFYVFLFSFLRKSAPGIGPLASRFQFDRFPFLLSVGIELYPDAVRSDPVLSAI